MRTHTKPTQLSNTQGVEKYIIRNNGVHLTVYVQGEPESPPLLFLHGFPDCHKTWQHQIAEFKKNYRVITFDMRGVNSSSGSSQKRAYHINNLLSDIEAIINQVLGNQHKVHLVGHDWGSVIGWSFIANENYSKRVLSYTSMSGPHLTLMLDWARRKIKSGERNAILEVFTQGVKSWYVYLFNLPLLPELIFKSFGKTIWKTVLKFNGVEASSDYLMTNQETVLGTCLNAINLYRHNPFDPPPIPRTNSITIPVQLIIPTQDMFVSPKLFEFYHEYVPDLSYQSINGKHWAHHSHRDEFNKMLHVFLERVESHKAVRKQKSLKATN